MRYSSISSVLLAAFSVGALMGSIGMYSPAPGPGVEANEFIHSRHQADLKAAQAVPQRSDAQPSRKINEQGKDSSQIHKLGPLLVLLPIFAHQGKG